MNFCASNAVSSPIRRPRLVRPRSRGLRGHGDTGLAIARVRDFVKQLEARADYPYDVAVVHAANDNRWPTARYLAGGTVLPGFVDVHVHVHGAVGHEVMDGTVAGLADMSTFFARHGVTSFLATTWTAGRDKTLTALGAVAEATAAGMPGAQLLGAHMEGPYLSGAKCGAHDRGTCVPPPWTRRDGSSMPGRCG